LKYQQLISVFILEHCQEVVSAKVVMHLGNQWVDWFNYQT